MTALNRISTSTRIQVEPKVILRSVSNATALNEYITDRWTNSSTALLNHPSAEENVIHLEPLSGPEIVERGLLGGWADKGIEDSAAWVEEQRRKRREANKW